MQRFVRYWRAWSAHPRRETLKAPDVVHVPDGLEEGLLPEPDHEPSALFRGGETVARERMGQWLKHCVEDYADGHDDLSQLQLRPAVGGSAPRGRLGPPGPDGRPARAGTPGER